MSTNMSQPIDPNTICANCTFYVSIFSDIGDCHRYPPTHVGDRSNSRVVSASDWCGEFKRSWEPKDAHI